MLPELVNPNLKVNWEVLSSIDMANSQFLGQSWRWATVL